MSIHEISIGQTASLDKQFQGEDVVSFAGLSSDFNPVHLDAEYATNTIFQHPIVHGFLVGSLISAVLGTQLPGPGSIYLGQNMKFLKPVFYGDLVRATVTVKAINLEKRIVTLDTVCARLVEGELIPVISGEAIIKII